jgi:hypothetical protein
MKFLQFAFKTILILLFFALSFGLQAQVGIGNVAPDPSSVLDITSTTQGLLIPRMTTAQRNSIPNPANGLTIYNLDSNEYQYNSGTSASATWLRMLSAALPNISVGQSVKYSNSNTTTDLKVSPAISVPIFGNFVWNDNASLYVVSGNQIAITEAGRYFINVNVSLYSNAARTAPDVQILVNGLAVGTIGASGYIRDASNHNNSSINFSEVLQLNANDVITLSSVRAASNGTVTMRTSGSSNIYIEKKS